MTALEIAESRAAQRVEAGIDPLLQKMKNWARIREMFPEHPTVKKIEYLRSRQAARQALQEAKMASAFVGGFSDQIVKIAIPLPATIAARGALNLAEYAGVMNVPKLRAFLGNLSNDLMRIGFKHALTGKRVPLKSVTAVASGIGLGAAPMLLYEQGWNYGRRVAETIEKVPGLRAMHPVSAARTLDTGVQAGMRHAPAIGAAGGAGVGMLEEKARHPRRDVTPKEFALAALEGGAKGALVGAGVRKFGPSLPGPKQLHKVRTEYLDQLVGGKRTRLERIFDRSAKQIARPAKELSLHQPGH